MTKRKTKRVTLDLVLGDHRALVSLAKGLGGTRAAAVRTAIRFMLELIRARQRGEMVAVIKKGGAMVEHRLETGTTLIYPPGTIALNTEAKYPSEQQNLV